MLLYDMESRRNELVQYASVDRSPVSGDLDGHRSVASAWLKKAAPSGANARMDGPDPALGRVTLSGRRR
jgi:hypothetical protein